MLQILNFYWSIEKDQPKQYLKLFDSEENQIKSIELENYNFNFELSEVRVCTGYYNQGEYIQCPNKTVMEAKETQCRYCESLEGFKSAFFFDQKPNENMKEYMYSKHEVYLAMFYPDKFKVGTSVENRIRIRTLEQDARFYLKLGNLVGTDVKKLEQYVSRTFGITEFVQSRSKYKSLSIKIDPKRAKEELERMFQKIDDHSFPEHLENSLYKTAKVEDNQQYYYFPETFERVRINNEKVLDGKFLGLRGRYILFKNFDQTLIEDVRYIIGRYIDGYTEGYEYPKPEQQSLL